MAKKESTGHRSRMRYPYSNDLRFGQTSEGPPDIEMALNRAAWPRALELHLSMRCCEIWEKICGLYTETTKVRQDNHRTGPGVKVLELRQTYYTFQEIWSSREDLELTPRAVGPSIVAIDGEQPIQQTRILKEATGWLQAEAAPASAMTEDQI
ncbi:hypothetical protein B0H13DRAFT_1876458 [Mycena leptocephala]|nr:hypothetical protein B0H13DRAFT_1876458 [Mycena leptocephala]